MANLPSTWVRGPLSRPRTRPRTRRRPRPREVILGPRIWFGPNALTGDLTGGCGFTFHKTIEDEDDDEYEDDFGAEPLWHISRYIPSHGLRSPSGGRLQYGRRREH